MVYFISRHRDLSYEDFQYYYIPIINQILEEDFLASFVVGDYNGVDKYAMDYIFNETDRELTIYHMFETPRNLPENYEPLDDTIYIMSGFKSDEERDAAMTAASDFDIAFVKDNRWNSGTAQNIKRRHGL